MTSQRNFAWSSLILNGLSARKKLTNPYKCDFRFVKYVFCRDKNLRFGRLFKNYESVCDRSTWPLIEIFRSVAGVVAIRVGHCALIGRYFEPCMVYQAYWKKHIQSPLIHCLPMCCELNYLATFHFMYSLTLHVIYFALSQVGWTQHRSPVYSITNVPVPSIIITILWPVVALAICELFKRRYIK